MMRRVILESPFHGANLQESLRNQIYLRQCLRHSLRLGEAPFASHAIYPGPLAEDVPGDRQLGIEAGYAWWSGAEAIVFYTDLGWSPGMWAAWNRAVSLNHRREIRQCT